MIAAVGASSIFYSHRYTNTVKVWGLYSVQFFNLFVGAPVVLLSLMNIALEIVQRPEVQNVPLSSNIIFLLFGLSIISTAIGIGIHSTSTSVSEAFPKGVRTKAFLINEVFHKYLSHELTNLGAIGISLSLGLLEINHPSQIPEFSLTIAVGLGLVISLVAASSIIRGTFIGLSIFASFLVSLMLAIPMYTLYSADKIISYPMAVTCFVSVTVTFILLSLAALGVSFSDAFAKKLVKFLFPTGHPVRESFHL